MKINLNDTIRIQLLSEKGADAYNRSFDMVRSVFPQYAHEYPRRAPGDFVELQLWDAMQIFGPHINAGGISPISCEIRILQDKAPAL